MHETTDSRRESICCVRGSGFVLHDSDGMDGTDAIARASLALGVAHHTLDWLHQRGHANRDFCVRASAEIDADGALTGGIAVAIDSKAIAIDAKSRADLQGYVGQRLRPAARLPELGDRQGV